MCGAIHSSQAHPLFSFAPAVLDNVRAMTPGRSYDVSPDGKRFLILEDRRPPCRLFRHLDVVLNWLEDLRRLTEPAK